MTLTGARGGALLGGGCSYPSGASRGVHLLPVRSHLVCLLPSGGGRPLLWGHGPCLAEARSSGCAWLSLSPATPTDTSSGQQVLRSGAGNVYIGPSGGSPGGGYLGGGTPDAEELAVVSVEEAMAV